jgi:hypothetical protein
VEITDRQVPGGVAVVVKARLTGREANRLFLSGDTLIQLPLDGALPEEGVPLPRMSIFLSELAGSRDGLTRVFADAASAHAFSAAVRAQLDTALEAP